MRFQTRLLATYTFLVVLLIVGLGVGFVLYSARLFETNARQTYELLADRMLEQLENQLRSMDFFETNLISDSAVKFALDTLDTMERADPRNGLDLEEASRTVKNAVVTYSAIKTFAAATLFNVHGDFFSSNFLEHAAVSDVGGVVRRLPWIPRAYELSGRRLILAPYDDPWVDQKPRRVYGLVRAMPGARGDLGFIEVQAGVEGLGRIFGVPDAGYVRVAAWTAEGASFYRSGDLPDEQTAVYAAWRPADEPRFTAHRGLPRTELLLRRESKDFGVSFVLALDREMLVRPVWVTGLLTVLVGLAILALSVLYNWWSSRQLTGPLRLVRDRIEATGLGTLPQAQPLDHPSDEIVALNDAFEALKERLDASIRDEIRTRTLGVRAQLDSLQAQVDPHFLYNVLNLLAAKGLEVGSREVGEICSGIAAMLRYSTDTSERDASLEAELRHVETYLSLMKKRLEDRLTFEIEVAPELRALRLPKIVLQPLVENALTHGFRDVDRPRRVRLEAGLTGDGWWIEVTDNGQGFGPADLERQGRLLEETVLALGRGSWTEGLSLGGLGLRNTVGRLALFFGGRIRWTLDNQPQGGARVRLEVPHA